MEDAPSALLRLAEDGAANFPPDDLGNLAATCWAHATATGDARYSILGQLFGDLDRGWGEQGLPTATVERLDYVLSKRLPTVVEIADPSDGAMAAASMKAELEGFMKT